MMGNDAKKSSLIDKGLSIKIYKVDAFNNFSSFRYIPNYT